MTNWVRPVFGVYVDWNADGDFSDTYEDISQYVMGVPSIVLGINSPMTFVAYVGQAEITLTNTDKRFSPAYPSGPLYGQLLPNLPVKITLSDGTTTWTVFRGFTQTFRPTSGLYGERQCTLTCVDYMALIQNEGISMPLQTNIRSDTLIRHILNIALKAAVATAVVTFTAIPSAGNTLTVNGYPLTWKASLTGSADEVLIGATAAASAQNLAAAVNKGTGAGTTYASNITLPRNITAQETLGEGYDASNYDTSVLLESVAGSGETVTVTSATTGIAQLGNNSGGGGDNPGVGQSITPAQTGRLSSVGLYFDGAATGSPNPISVKVYQGSSPLTGTLLYTGSWSPTPTAGSNWQDFSIIDGPILQASTQYVVTYECRGLADGNYYLVWASNTDVYAGGVHWYDVGAGWASSSTFDLSTRFTTTALTEKTKLDQSFAMSSSQAVGTVQLYLRKFGTPTGTLTLRIESDSGGTPSGSLADTNATTTLAESSLTTSFALTTFTFDPPPALLSGVTYHLVLSTSRSASATDFVAWGADGSSPGYANGAMYSYATGSWSAESKDAIFSTGATIVTLSAVIPGTVGNAYTLAKVGTWCTLSDSAFSGGVDYPTALPPSLETGESTFPYAGDAWSNDSVNSMTALEQTVQSEYNSFFWVARNGTLTFKNRTYLFRRTVAAATLTLSSEHNAVEGALGDDDVYNRVEVKYTPLSTLSSGVVAQAKGTVSVPGLTGLTERWNPTQVLRNQAGSVVTKLPFTDPTTQQAMGALSIITPLAPTTDWTANEDQSGTGVDYTGNANLKFSVALNGANAEVTITNTALGPLYITMLKIRGVGLVHYNAQTATVEDVDSETSYGKRVLSLELPIASSDLTYGQSLAAYLLSRYKDPAYRLTSITFNQQNVVGTVNLFSLELGDVLSVTDAQTGVSAAKYMIVGMQYADIGPGRTGSVTFNLFALADTAFWVLEDPVYSILGSTTRPAL